MARRRSNTVGNKIKEQDALAQKVNNIPSQQPQICKITLRRTNKSSHIMEVQSNVTGQYLFKTAEKEFYIQQQNQILFYKSQKIVPSNQSKRRNFSFAQKDIIHVHNKKFIFRQSITIYLAFLNNQLVKFNELVLTANSDQLIKHALQDSFLYQFEKAFKCYFAQSGRFINIDQSFQHQSIQDGSIVLIMPRKQNMSPLGKLQERQIQLLQSKSKNLSSSGKYSITDKQPPNFKKKCKCCVYHSTLIIESKQLIWQQESYNSESAKKIVYRRFIRKKAKKQPKLANSIQNLNLKQNLISSIRAQVGSEKQISITQIENSKRLQKQKQKGKQQEIEKKKLYSSAILIKGVQPKILKPPQPKKDLFKDIEGFQQELICMDIQQEDDDDDDDDLNDNLGSSAPLSNFMSLKNSIGKTRGIFDVPPTLPSGPPQLLEDDDQEFEDF